MAQLEPERSVQQCLLDRLIDEEPQNSAEPPPSRAQSLRLFRAAVRRDLEWLLNTNRTIEPVPESFTEVNGSLFTYGLPDISSMSLNSPQDERRLIRALETAITTFEPRLRNVRVTPRQQLTKTVQSLQFEIDALLMIDPAPERISFDTVLEVARGNYEVKGS